MPEWYLVVLALGALSAMGTLWRPFFFAMPMLVLVLGAPVAQAALAAGQATFAGAPSSFVARLQRRGLTFALHLLQPIARLYGRLRNGLHPWRQWNASKLAVPRPQTYSLWREQWQSADETLRSVETALRTDGAIVVSGGVYDGWDLGVQGGLLGGVRTRIVVEEHGAGRQMVRFRFWPRCSTVGGAIALVFTFCSIGGAFDQAWTACIIFAILALLFGGAIFYDCAVATAALLRSLRQLHPEGSCERSLSRRKWAPHFFPTWGPLDQPEGTVEAEKTL